MTYERFEDLPVWQEAIRLAEGCEDFLIAAKDYRFEIIGRVLFPATPRLGGFLAEFGDRGPAPFERAQPRGMAEGQ